MLEAYTAGFLDADGTVSLAKKSDKEHLRYPIIEFYNCDITILEKIRERWGGSIRARHRKEHHSVSYTLTITHNKAYVLLKEVVPYMIHAKKRIRAEMIVNDYLDLKPVGRYTNTLIEQKLIWIKKLLGIQMRGKGAYDNREKFGIRTFEDKVG